MSAAKQSGEVRNLPFAPMYAVNSQGEFWSYYRGRVIRSVLDSHGYACVRLSFDGKRKHMPIHRIMASIFLPPRPSPAHEVCHRDGNKLNNAADNLRWGTRKENAADRAAHGRTSTGERHSAAIKASNQAEGTRAFRRAQRESRNV